MTTDASQGGAARWACKAGKIAGAVLTGRAARPRTVHRGKAEATRAKTPAAFLRWWRYGRHLLAFAVTTDPSHARECEHYRRTLHLTAPRAAL